MAGFRLTEDHTAEVIAAKNAAVERALEMIGIKVENYAKELCPVDTGNLRNSITHQVDGEGATATVTIGAGAEYAPYVELGTGKNFTPPPEWIEHQGKKGRGLDSWVYQDKEGNWHRAYPMKARPFLRPAVENHKDEFETILKNELQG